MYASVSLGSGTIEPYDDYYDYDAEDQGTSGGGIGIILNGYLGDGILVNRFMFMVEFMTLEIDSPGYEYEISSMSLYDTLGFIISKKDRMSVWLGPQLGIRFLSATDESDTEYGGAGLTIGAAIGADFKTSDRVSIGIEGGIRYCISNVESSEAGSPGADFYSTEGFIGVCFLYKI